MADILQRIASGLYEGEYESVTGRVQEALDQDLTPNEVLQGGLIAGMAQGGRDF